ncbi:hypothetical protein RclHR1_01650031 [Rhizophagus clarus]|uniref:Uncharacterized protein n=1 Tax=Rhizophagus clarus TaxID=94130 RepID=A0A2Z6QWV2_9GLOM|nr:hypothetical protein RclHR1_01650031 [Rhizophagus clarus]
MVTEFILKPWITRLEEEYVCWYSGEWTLSAWKEREKYQVIFEILEGKNTRCLFESFMPDGASIVQFTRAHAWKFISKNEIKISSFSIQVAQVSLSHDCNFHDGATGVLRPATCSHDEKLEMLKTCKDIEFILKPWITRLEEEYVCWYSGEWTLSAWKEREKYQVIFEILEGKNTRCLFESFMPDGASIVQFTRAHAWKVINQNNIQLTRILYFDTYEKIATCDYHKIKY